MKIILKPGCTEDKKRYIIVDDNDENVVIDDSQGFGFRSIESAAKQMQHALNRQRKLNNPLEYQSKYPVRERAKKTRPAPKHKFVGNMQIVDMPEPKQSNAEPWDAEYTGQRFMIIDDATGEVVDDAQGYGYTTRQKAHKAFWYKFQGGKEKMKKKDKEREEFFAQHPGLDKFITDIYDNNFKELARGEYTEQDILNAVKEELGVDLPEKYL